MPSHAPLYLGFDLSTQQLKAIAVTTDLSVVCEARFEFDVDSTYHEVEKGVITNGKEQEVYAPVSMWLQAVDVVLQRLKDKGLDFSRIDGISGAGQQHGSVYWSEESEDLLRNLASDTTLEHQLQSAFSHPYSPNWQDASTQKECDDFDAVLGSEAALAQNTGSKAHHRFTGPQILRFRERHPLEYQKTARISLVSSFLASIFLGRIAPFDVSDVCGMNLWDIKAGTWNEKLLGLIAGSSGVGNLLKKLGQVPKDGGGSLGNINSYFVKRFGFKPECAIAPFTGDNPATILALPLRPNDAIVSLGTSTTFLMSTPIYKPDPAVHFFNHPTTAGLYMFMLCYKNGGLAREQVRDAINRDIESSPVSKSWEKFDRSAFTTPPLGQASETAPMKLGLFFPRPEIVPNVGAGEWRFVYDADTGTLTKAGNSWKKLQDDARAIIESQMLSLRLRSRGLVESPGHGLPAQPRRIYLVGGGSQDVAIARIAGEVLGGLEGVFKLDVGENACVLGAAYKAVWAVERIPGQTFEDLIGSRWKEDAFVEKITDGYQEGVFEKYGLAVEGFEKMEKYILDQEEARRSSP